MKLKERTRIRKENNEGLGRNNETVIYIRKRELIPGEMSFFTHSVPLFSATPEGQCVWTTFIHNVSLCQDFINTLGTCPYPGQQNTVVEETFGMDDLISNIKSFLSS